MDHGRPRQVVCHLAHEHDIHTLVADGWRPGTSDRRGNSTGRGKGGGDTVELESNGNHADPSSCTPTDCDPGQVPQSGAQIQ
jgi:hypothetical protein